MSWTAAASATHLFSKSQRIIFSFSIFSCTQFLVHTLTTTCVALKKSTPNGFHTLKRNVLNRSKVSQSRRRCRAVRSPNLDSPDRLTTSLLLHSVRGCVWHRLHRHYPYHPFTTLSACNGALSCPPWITGDTFDVLNLYMSKNSLSFVHTPVQRSESLMTERSLVFSSR